MSEITATVKAEESEKKGKNAKRSTIDPSFNMDELRELADLVDEHGLTEFEFENENIRVRISKMTAPPVVQAPLTPVSVPGQMPQASTSTAESPQPAPEPDADQGLHKIVSPIVGTFYRAPGPDKAPYVSEGDIVSPETVVCIVEAMKLMNEIQAETSGTVVRVYVENGQPVEYGQPLFVIQ